MHDLAVFDGNHRDEPVVIRGTARDYPAVYLVFDDHHMRVLRSVNDERVRAMQDDAVAVACVKRQERLTTIQYLGPAWENISKLEHRRVGDRIKIVLAVNETGQALQCYFEKWIERREGRVLRMGHKLTPVVVREICGLPFHLQVRITVVRNFATTPAPSLDACDWWRESAAAEGATGAIDLSEEHHDMVGISARALERFDYCRRQTLLPIGIGPGRHKHFDHQHLLRSGFRQTRIVLIDFQVGRLKTKQALEHVVVRISCLHACFMYGSRDRVFLLSSYARFHRHGEQWHESLPVI